MKDRACPSACLAQREQIRKLVDLLWIALRCVALRDQSVWHSFESLRKLTHTMDSISSNGKFESNRPMRLRLSCLFVVFNKRKENESLVGSPPHPDGSGILLLASKER